MLKSSKLRIARPSRDLANTEQFYCQGLGLTLLGRFEDHDGIDGIMLGDPKCAYHFEFTRHRAILVKPSPTPEDLIVFYIPSYEEWQRVIKSLENNSFSPVKSLNPYWDIEGKTYQDPDGYRIVIQNAEWQ